MLMGVNKSTMKKLLQKFKNGGSWLGNKAIEYRACFYVFFITSMLFVGLLARQAITHSVETIKLTKEKIILNMENNTLKDAVRGQESSIKLGITLINRQNQQLKDADRLIKMQHDALKRLMEHLKNLNEWLPDEGPVDPNTIT